MFKKYYLTFFLLFFFCNPIFGEIRGNPYLWSGRYEQANNIPNRIEPPPGYQRVSLEQTSFQNWLRHLPLKSGHPPVYLHSGELKKNQEAHYAVIDIDTGSEDLQQCADAIIRLRAEYLFWREKYDLIKFNFTSGDEAKFEYWIQGYRPIVIGNFVKWTKRKKPDLSYKAFREYLKIVFIYAGTYSYSKELLPIENISEIEIGDVFIQGGFPGHAVIVVDLSVNPKTKKKVFLLSQSYMPAQDIHILKNPNNKELSPWYSEDFEKKLVTPEWIFNKTQLRRMK